MKAWEVFALGAPFVLALAGWYALRANPLPSRPTNERARAPFVEPPVAPSPREETARPQDAPTHAAAPSELPAPDEASAIAALHSSMNAEPERTIAAARAVEAEFGRSAAAAERAWLVARALVNLGRFHEARDEAQRAVRDFPDSSWALDLQHHLLVQPLDYPAREDQAY